MRGVVAILLFCLSSFLASAQTNYPGTGSKTGTNRFLGGLVVDSMLKVPIRVPANWMNTTNMQGAIQLSPLDSGLVYNNGREWIKLDLRRFVDSVFNSISLPQVKAFVVPSSGNTFFDSALVQVHILNIDRNGFNESEYTQASNGVLTFSDGIFAGEHLKILYTAKVGAGGGGSTPDSSAIYPFVIITTNTGGELTLPSSIKFLLTIDQGGVVPLSPADYTISGNRIVLNPGLNAPDGEIFRVIYW